MIANLLKRLQEAYPIKRKDLWKLVPMFVMLFCICLNYSILRNLKDAVVVTAQGSGAEAIPFIKVYFMLPMAFLLTVLFTKLSNRYSQEKVFYIMVSLFLCFYALFAFILYPLRDTLHPHETADWFQGILPLGCKGLVATFRNWTFTSFYVMCELWGSVVLSVLFWSFANEITKVSEAGYFYGALGVGANLATLIAGQIGATFSIRSFNPALPFGNDAWEQAIMVMILLMIVSGTVIMGTFYWMNRYVLDDPAFDGLHRAGNQVKKKKKLSVRESFRYLSKSKYLLCIAVLVLSYNLVINLVEIVWKDQLRLLYPNPADFNVYINNLTSLVGTISTVAAVMMPWTIKKCGWTVTALMTPVTMLVTTIGFFVFFLGKDHLGELVIISTGMTPLALAVFFGSAQNCLSKAAKYSVFDTTKDMAFIPLDHDSKLKGKAAIDGFGSRLGKSGGSIIHQALLIIFSTLSASAPFVAMFIIGSIVMWIGATKSLGKQFAELTAPPEPVAEDPVAEPEPALS